MHGISCARNVLISLHRKSHFRVFLNLAFTGNKMQEVRQIAYRLSIGDLNSGQLSLDNERFNFLEVAGKKIARINLIASVIDKFSSDDPEKQYINLTIDDGSGQIRIKAFSDSTKMLSEIQMGDTICVIGWLRWFNNEIYILPEIVNQVDHKWALVRKMELSDRKEGPKDARKMIFDLIKQNDDGIGIDELIMKTQIPIEQLNSTVRSLIEEGEVYEPRPGKLRSMN